MEADAAKRAAAAEARRQKILARGAERLSRITVGTPLPTTDASDSSTPSELPAPAAAASDSADASASSPIADQHAPAVPATASTADVDATTTTTTTSGALTIEHEAAAAEETSMPASVLASADSMLQEVLRGSGGQLGQDTAALQAAQRNAEQALHMLLTQLASPSGAPYFVQPLSPAGPSGSAATVGGAGSSGRTTGVRGGDDTAGNNGDQAAATATAAAATTGFGRSSSPSAPPASGGVRGILIISGVRSLISRLLLVLAAAVAAVAGLLLGPQLTAAVEATRRLRCVAAVALAGLLYGGVVEPAHLQLPPVVALLVLQGALVAAARALGGRTATATSDRSAFVLSKTASGTDLAAGGGGGASNAVDGDGASAAAAAGSTAPAPPPRFDWAALVPGLRPFLDKLSSAGVLVSALFGDVAVFVVSYLVLDAWSQVAGRRAVLSAGP